MIQGEYIVGTRVPQPRFRHIRRNRMATLVLFGLSLLIGLNLIRVLHVNDTAVTSALSAATNPTAHSNTTDQPNIEVQTYAPTATPPESAAQDAAALLAASTPTVTATPQAPKDCSGNQYILPSPQDLSNSPLGLTKTVDQPTYYQVYGNSLSALRTAITNCQYRKAAGSFHATTAYQLNWRYTATAAGNNQCTLSNVRVGLHINQLMPLFIPNGTTPTSVTSSWNAYTTNLGIHEAGHVDIDTQYADKLLAALQSMGSVDCSLISRQAQTTIDSYVAMLNAANDLYDSRTNHGATQGATL